MSQTSLLHAVYRSVRGFFRTHAAVAVLATSALTLGAVAPAQAGSTYAATKYPIVLAHGLSGTSKFLGVVDYWYQIPEDLRANGANVYVADVSAFNDETVRGEQLVSQIRTVLATTGAARPGGLRHHHRHAAQGLGVCGLCGEHTGAIPGPGESGRRRVRLGARLVQRQ